MSVIHWTGISGKMYEYSVIGLPASPPSGKGNYIFAKKAMNDYGAVYVGQGDLKDRYDAAIQEGCVTRRGATHYCAHIRNAYSESERLLEEQDIIAGNQECLKQNGGCNEQAP